MIYDFRVRNGFSKIFSMNLHLAICNSVTRLGEFTPLWQIFKNSWAFSEYLLSIWQNILLTLTS